MIVSPALRNVPACRENGRVTRSPTTSRRRGAAGAALAWRATQSMSSSADAAGCSSGTRGRRRGRR
jgi:hypothetical protein